VVFLKPAAVAPAVVRRDGRVQAGGHPADHARLGLAEERLDELCGSPGVIDEIARTVLLGGKVKGAARRALTPALAIRLTLLMTLMPDADYAEVMAALLGDLPLVTRNCGSCAARRPPPAPPWRWPPARPVPTPAAAGTRARPKQVLLDKAVKDSRHVFTPGRLWVMDRNYPGVLRIKALLETGTHVLIRVRDGITLHRHGEFLPDGSYLASITGSGPR